VTLTKLVTSEELEADADKASDAMHRCLTDSTIDPDVGNCPLSHVVLGRRQSHDEYYVVTGRVSLNWPRCNSLIWPHPDATRRCV